MTGGSCYVAFYGAVKGVVDAAASSTCAFQATVLQCTKGVISPCRALAAIALRVVQAVIEEASTTHVHTSSCARVCVCVCVTFCPGSWVFSSATRVR